MSIDPMLIAHRLPLFEHAPHLRLPRDICDPIVWADARGVSYWHPIDRIPTHYPLAVADEATFNEAVRLILPDARADIEAKLTMAEYPSEYWGGYPEAARRVYRRDAEFFQGTSDTPGEGQ